VPGVIASMGTSLTAGQASLIRRFTRNVVIAYDGDAAGRNATLRAAQVLLAAGLNVSALDLQGEKDPDSLVQKYGADKFLDVLSHALDIFEFGIGEWGQNAAQLSGREKSERVDNFMPLLSAVTDPVIRNEAAQRIADAFRLEFESVWSRVRGKAVVPREEALKRPPTRDEKATAQKKVLLAAVQGRLTADQLARLTEELFDDPVCRTLFLIIKNDIMAGRPIDFENVQTHLRGEAELTLLSELSLSDDIDDQILARFEQNIIPLERGYLERRKQQNQREIEEAARAGDAVAVKELITQKMEIVRKLDSLK